MNPKEDLNLPRGKGGILPDPEEISISEGEGRGPS